MYAKRLTKEDLIKEGISIELDEAARDIKVYHNGKPVKLSTSNNGYLFFSNVYARDVNGNIIKRPAKRKYKDKTYDYYTYKTRSIPLHRAVYAWVNGEVPEGKVVDHISNKHDSIQDYWPDNLQLLTPKQNVNKDKQREAKPRKCNMHKPRGFYEAKLDKYEGLYKTARQEGDQEACHRLRNCVSQTRARLKYWDAHVGEFAKYNANLELKKFLKGQISDLLNEIEDQKANNVVCEQNGWDYFRDLGVWIIKMKRDKIRELKKELKALK